MQTDPIVAEVRRIREEIAARFGYDVDAIGRDARQRDALGDRTVVRLPPRRPVATEKATPRPLPDPASVPTSVPAT